MRILIIEDDEYYCSLWYAALTIEGWEVHMASTAGEAFFLLGVFVPDFIISDVRLPDGDGFAIRLELNRRKVNIPPTIFVTSYLPQDAVLLARKLGAAALLTKPVKGSELVALVKRIMPKEE